MSATLRRRLLEALLACALGGALGLLSDQARAANVTLDHEQMQEDLETCWIARYSGGLPFVQCLGVVGRFHGARQHDWIEAIWTCAAQQKPLCIPMLAHIKEHWGVQAALGRARAAE